MGFILFLIAVTLFLFFPLSTYILFWYETANSGYRDELLRLSQGRPGTWIFRAWLSSVMSHVVLVLTLPLGWVRNLWRPSPGIGTGPTVILIHGLYHNPSAWIRLRWALKRAGYERLYAFPYKSFGPDFLEISRQLERWILEITRAVPGEEVVLVGHSMGGLLAAAYGARDDASRGPGVKAIITLGTPFGGSKTTVFGIGRLAKSLTFGGALIQELAARRVPPGVTCVALRSPVDNLVLPADALRPPSGWREEVIAPICHVAMLYHGPTIRRVLHHMEAGISRKG